jgi:ABC-2 type transport system permease protein
MNRTVRNIVTLARREYLWRVRSRTFAITTAFLIAIAVAVALAPVLLRYVNPTGTTKIEVVAADWTSPVPVETALGTLLNATAGQQTGSEPPFQVSRVADASTARANVDAGKAAGVLEISGGTSGDPTFAFYTKGQPFERVPQLVGQAATALAVQERLSRAGVSPTDQARMFAPASYTVVAAGASEGSRDQSNVEELVSSSAVSFALTIFIFMAIIGYGNWVAMSVAEEKSSRVMEVILGAATPFQLLAGKVVGAGAAALTQYVALAVPAGLAIVLQDRIAGALLGGSTGSGLATGLTVGMLATFGVFFVLGFGLYAVLYAGAASLVTRQEDVNQMVMPLTLLSTAGYMVAAYAGSGLIEARSPLVTVLSYVPLTSPYLMLSRVGAGLVGPLEVAVAVALLVVTIPAALWLAARLYRAGVLMYGQKPSLATLARALRTA